MEEQKKCISVEDLMVEIKLLIKEEIVARYTEKDGELQMHFINGQSFRVFIEEIK